MSIVALVQLDLRLFALARPGGPLSSQSARFTIVNRVPGLQSQETTVVSAQTSPEVEPPPTSHASSRQSSSERSLRHPSRSSTRSLVRTKWGDGAEQRPRKLDSTSVYSKLDTPPSHRGGTSVQAVFRVQVNRGTDEDIHAQTEQMQAQGVLVDSLLSEDYGMGTASMEQPTQGDGAERRPQKLVSASGYRNLKTLPSRGGKTFNQAVFRPQVSRADEDTHVQMEQAQGFWADPLISEGYGMGTASMEWVLEDGTSQVCQRPERLEALPTVEQATSEALSNPKPFLRHSSSDRSRPTQGPSSGTPLGRSVSISADPSDYHSFLDEVKKEDNFQSEWDTKLNEEIEELSNKYGALSDKVDIVVEGNQEVLEEVQSLRETISTMIANTRQSTTPSKLASPDTKKLGLPKRRAVETLVLVMGEAGGGEALTSVGANDTERFAKLCSGNDGDGGDCCTVDDFRIDLIGLPRSLWNTSAANVFVHAFEAFTGMELDWQMVRTAFFTWLKTLKQEYKLSKKSKREQQNSFIQKRRKMRKRMLFTQRHETALHDHCLHKHIALLNHLGVDGMSSDESDGEECMGSEMHSARPTFRVRRPVWRAQVVGRWLQAFDSLYLRRRQVSQDKRGCYPRVRIQDNAEPSTSKDFVAGLLLNAYDQVWMVGQSDVCAFQEHGDFSPVESTE
ncbi:hypothetical protein BDN71DRAFT_1498969 [Pleurotus eryngii]|uniref:Uncharacterized protein n=1 Tax=Pleurotus eryngii TaxID=5323 RepID=A0A9P6DBI3_PLEER|nr:hypothetical protein BDN71DRAFT_1498969 [Pleurotus eryngii]